MIYKDLVNEIVSEGIWDKDQEVRPKWKSDNTPAYTKSIISKKITLDNSEVPILTTKDFSKSWITSLHEMLWFYVERTSNAAYLDKHNVKIWKPWTSPNNTINLAYGAQLGKQIRTGKKIKTDNKFYNEVGIYEVHELTNQVHKLINDLKTNPASRRSIICLWNIDDLWNMPLYPCVWNSQWLVKQDRLHLIVQIRSSDTALGLPFNVFQYYVLQRMIAQVTGYELGTLTFNINDSHVYERHIGDIVNQIKREPFEAPILNINPDIKNFDDFTINDFELIGYKHHDKVQFEISV